MKNPVIVGVTFEPSAYLRVEYDMKPAAVYVDRAADLPYYGVPLCVEHEDGSLTSRLECDKGLSWEESKAKKIFEDKLVVEKRSCDRIAYSKKPQGERVKVYTLLFTNPKSSIFRKSIHRPINNAMNVETEYALEFLFAFDGGYILPVVEHIKVSGNDATFVSHQIENIASNLAFPEFVADLLKSSKNVRISEDMFKILCSNEDTGYVDEIELSMDKYGCSDIQRALCSVRIVEFSETIL